MTNVQGTTLAYGGPTHVLLRYAHMKRNTPFTPRDAMSTFPAKFSRESKVLESLKRLASKGFVYKSPSGWVITEMGSAFLWATAHKARGED